MDQHEFTSQVEALIAEDKYQEALQVCVQWEQIDTDILPLIYNVKGAILINHLKRVQEGLAAFEQAETENGGQYPEASFGRGSVLSQLNRQEEALVAYQKGGRQWRPIPGGFLQ